MAPFNTDLTVTAPQLPDPMQLAQQQGEIMKNMAALKYTQLATEHQAIQNQAAKLDLGIKQLALIANNPTDETVNNVFDKAIADGLVDPTHAEPMRQAILGYGLADRSAAIVKMAAAPAQQYDAMVGLARQRQDQLFAAQQAREAQRATLAEPTIPGTVPTTGFNPVAGPNRLAGQPQNALVMPQQPQQGPQQPQQPQQPSVKPPAAAAAAPQQYGTQGMSPMERQAVANEKPDADQKTKLINQNANYVLKSIDKLLADKKLINSFIGGGSAAMARTAGAKLEGTPLANQQWAKYKSLVDQIKKYTNFDQIIAQRTQGGANSRVPTGMFHEAGGMINRLREDLTPQEFVSVLNDLRTYIKDEQQNMSEKYESLYHSGAPQPASARTTTGGGQKGRSIGDLMKQYGAQ